MNKSDDGEETVDESNLDSDVTRTRRKRRRKKSGSDPVYTCNYLENKDTRLYSNIDYELNRKKKEEWAKQVNFKEDDQPKMRSKKNRRAKLVKKIKFQPKPSFLNAITSMETTDVTDVSETGNEFTNYRDRLEEDDGFKPPFTIILEDKELTNGDYQALSDLSSNPDQKLNRRDSAKPGSKEVENSQTSLRDYEETAFATLIAPAKTTPPSLMSDNGNERPNSSAVGKGAGNQVYPAEVLLGSTISMADSYKSSNVLETNEKQGNKSRYWKSSALQNNNGSSSLTPITLNTLDSETQSNRMIFSNGHKRSSSKLTNQDDQKNEKKKCCACWSQMSKKSKIIILIVVSILLLILLICLIVGIVLLVIYAYYPCLVTSCNSKASTCVNHWFRAQCICDNGYGGDGKNYCDECGLVYSSPNLKVIGGQDAVSYSWPALAYIVFRYTTDLTINGQTIYGYEYSLYCSGFLIDRVTVVTVAHCITTEFAITDNNGTAFVIKVVPNKYYSSVASMYTVYLGQYDLNYLYDAPAQEFSVRTIVKHENYDSVNVLNDVALLILNTQVTLDSYIQIACLPDRSVSYYPTLTDIAGYVAGWGDMYNNNTFPYILQNAKINVYDGSYCQNVYPSLTKNWNTQMCAGNYSGYVDTCQGDSGSALYVYDTLNGKSKYIAAGITSYGQSCGQPGYPGIYTR